jgi:L-fucose mutarotase
LLRGIPSIISPDLMKALMEMGHGDEIIFSDRNYPAASNARLLIRCDGHSIPDLLKAIFPLFPLDYTVTQPAVVMSLLPDQNRPLVWDTYLEIIRNYEPTVEDFEYVDRHEFYDRSKKAYAIVSTGDCSFKGNLLLKKGVVRD